jgi:hypothetical protein
MLAGSQIASIRVPVITGLLGSGVAIEIWFSILIRQLLRRGNFTLAA